jgi:hypothetical protein
MTILQVFGLIVIAALLVFIGYRAYQLSERPDDSPAGVLRRQAVAIAIQDRVERWVKVKAGIEAEVKAEASKGRTYLNLNDGHGTDLFKPGRPGYEWAVSQGFRITGGNGPWSGGHGYMDSWPQIRWD